MTNRNRTVGANVPYASRPAGSLDLDLMPEPWMEWAACASAADVEIFFPEKGDPARAAILVCATCPVVASCLEYAIRRGERFGVWGGTTARQRRDGSASLATFEANVARMERTAEREAAALRRRRRPPAERSPLETNQPYRKESP